MKQRNQNERTISDFVEVNGIGTVAFKKGYVDVFVYGYFTRWRWSFIVHQDPKYPDLIMVSEASTGYRIKNERYYSVSDALYYILPIVESMHYKFATKVGDILVKTQCNLLKRNTTNLQTMAIDMLWMKS